MKKFICMILLFVMLLGACAFPCAADSSPFVDVSYDSWYYDAVMFCYRQGLMYGVGTDNSFAPNKELTRAQLVQTLYKFEGAPDTEGEAVFTDVYSDRWYTDAVTWAYNAGVVGGMGDGTFGTDAPLTREQLATVLRAFAKEKELACAGTVANIDGYSDSENVSAWAQDAVGWAVANGVMSGTGNNTISAKAPVTRAQMSLVLMNFSDLADEVFSTINVEVNAYCIYEGFYDLYDLPSNSVSSYSATPHKCYVEIKFSGDGLTDDMISGDDISVSLSYGASYVMKEYSKPKKTGELTYVVGNRMYDTSAWHDFNLYPGSVQPVYIDISLRTKVLSLVFFPVVQIKYEH